jgi:DNA-binding transcriptional MerR regulator
METKNRFIGDLSKEAGVPVKTIRYYEDLGIMKKPKRSLSEYRVYTEQDVEKLLFIKKAKELGLTLTEIKEILTESQRGLKPTCCLVRDIFNKKIKEYEAKINEFKQTKEKLEQKLKSWIEPHEASQLDYTVCPQIDSKPKNVKSGHKKRG